MMIVKHTSREVRHERLMVARTSGMQGDGVLGTRPDRERGIRPAAIGRRSSWDVCAAGEFPRSATQSNGRRTDGVSVLTGKAVRWALSVRVGDAAESVLGERAAGTCGRIHPPGEMEHTRRTGRKQGVRVAGSGHAAVGGSSAGVFRSLTWRSAQTEGGAGSPSFPAGRDLAPRRQLLASRGALGHEGTDWSPRPLRTEGMQHTIGTTNTRKGNA